MGYWQKALFAIACVAVIAAGGLYGWSQWSLHQERLAHMDAVKAAQDYLAYLSDEAFQDPTRTFDLCQMVRKDYKVVNTQERAHLVVQACNLVGI